MCESREHVTVWNQSVLFEFGRGYTTLHQIVSGGTLKTKQGRIPNENLVAMELGKWYEILPDMTLSRIERKKDSKEMEITRDNRNFVDDGTAQQLSQDEIEVLKQQQEEGLIGTTELVANLVKHSTTFDHKNEYSQSKYVQKKETKFSRTIRAILPNPHRLSGYFFERKPWKIQYLRQDTFSQLILACQIRPNIHVLVIDDTGGFVSGCIVSRLNGCGKVVSICERSQVMRMMSLLNLNDQQKSVLETKTLDNVSEDCAFDCLLIATDRMDCVDIIKGFSRHVRISRPVVVFHPFREALLSVYAYCRESTEFVNIMLTESTMRKYQVLPDRFHPENSMSGTGGYLLTMLKV